MAEEVTAEVESTEVGESQGGQVEESAAAIAEESKKEFQQAKAWRDELAARAGEGDEEEDKQEATEKADKTPEKKESAPEEGVEEAKAKKSREDANRAFRERQEKKRQQQQEVERLRAEAEQGRLYRQMLEDLARQPVAGQDQQQVDPDAEPDPTVDPQAWHKWNYRQLEKKIEEPRILAERQAQEAAYRQQQLHQAAQHVAQELWTAGDEYEATEEGAGFHNRIQQYVDGLGERLEQLGQDPNKAYDSLRALLDSGVREGQNPWVFADRVIQTMGYAWMGSGTPEPPKSTSAGNERIAQLSAAAKAPEARTVDDMSSASSTGDVSIEALAKSGQMNTTALQKRLQKDGKFSRRGILDAMAQMDKAIRS